MRNPVERSRRLRDGTSWRTFMRLLRLDDLMTSYTHGRHIAIPEKSVFRLICRVFGIWGTSSPHSENPVYQDLVTRTFLRVRPVILVVSDFLTPEQQSTANDRTHQTIR